MLINIKTFAVSKRKPYQFSQKIAFIYQSKYSSVNKKTRKPTYFLNHVGLRNRK